MRIVFLALALCAFATLSPAADDQQISRQRQEIVDAIRTDRPESVTDLRAVCMSGDEPANVREWRGKGLDFTPDAFDSCFAALVRKGKDNALLDAYKKLTGELKGNVEISDRLPRAIGAAVLNGNNTASIGNGKGVKIDAALAFDAGFTVAYMSGAARKEGLVPQKLRPIVEGCLDERKDASTCFSVGYALGAEAVSAQ